MKQLMALFISLFVVANSYAIEYCDYFPESVQTNYRQNGYPYVSQVDFSGHDQTLTFDVDGFKMPFNYLANSPAHNGTAAHCYYPNAPTDSCAVNPTNHAPTLPVDLPAFPTNLEPSNCSDKHCSLPSGSKVQSITMRQGKTLTLEGGEIWIGSLTLEHAAKIKVSSPTILHYRQFYISGHSHINKDGTVTDLILIGHGSNAAINLTNHNKISAALYVDPSSFQKGLTVSGEHNDLNMNITVNHMSVTGKKNTFNLPKLCDDTPPPPEFKLDLCPYFKEEVQTTLYDTSGSPQGLLNVNSEYDDDRDEWFDDFDVNAIVLPRNNTGLAFSGFTNNSTYGGCFYTSSFIGLRGFGWQNCQVEPTKSFENYPPQLDDFPSGDYSSDFKCKDGKVCHLKWTNNKINKLEVKDDSKLIIDSGEYWVNEHIHLEDAEIQLINGPVKINYRGIKANGDLYPPHFKDELKINTLGNSEDLLFVGHGAGSDIEIESEDSVIKAYFYVPPEAATVGTRGFLVNGEDNYIFGGVAAPNVTLGERDYDDQKRHKDRDDNDVEGEGNVLFARIPVQCKAPPPSQDYYLELEPLKGIALSCETQRVTFNVVDKYGKPIEDYTKGVRITAPASATLQLIEGVRISEGLYNPSANGRVIFDVSSHHIEQLSVSGELVESANNTLVTGNYEFTANKFEFTPQASSLIAGKSATIEVRPVTCSVTRSGLSQVVAAKNYSGVQNVDIAATRYLEPKSPTVQASIKVKVAQSNDFVPIPVTDLALDFSHGSSTPDAGHSALMDIQYDEAGRVSFELSQTRCVDESEQSPLGKQGAEAAKQCVTYKGVHELKVRPWTFAICDASNYQLALDGTSSQGSSYKAAGERFNLDAVPIRWQKNGATQGQVPILPSFCQSQFITKNYFDTDAPVSSVLLSATENTPAVRPVDERFPIKMDGEDGSTFVRSNRGSNGVLPFYALYWEDVGSLLVQTQSQSNYLGMAINPSSRSIGRFYPHHLAMISNQWGYESGHSEFAYMGQPIKPGFVVEARNLEKSPTPNYGYFVPNLMVTLNHVAANDSGDSYLPRISATATSWGSEAWKCDSTDSSCSTSRARLEASFGDYVFAKRYQLDGVTSIKELPVKGHFGVQSNLVDGVDFEGPSLMVNGTNAKAFPIQPEFRYGRMVMDNVGGDLTTDINIPLRTEYWTETGFALNDADSGSVFNGKHYCRQILWSGQLETDAKLFNKDGNTITTEDAVISQGSSSQLFASNNRIREQVNLWLRLDHGAPIKLNQNDSAIKCFDSNAGRSWLRYNWRGVGDEDPHAVVTFGSHRGNDRVIYRGEPRLIGQ